MAEENKEPWLNYLALTTVIFAVCATLSTFKGGGYSTRSVMSQSQASDQWAFYQAKAIKSYIYQAQQEKLELELQTLDSKASPATVTAFQNRLAEYRHKLDKFEKDKADIQAKAKALEAARDEAQIHSKAFGVAVIYLQIAILLSSIAGLLKRKSIWYGGIISGLIGLSYFADGFFV